MQRESRRPASLLDELNEAPQTDATREEPDRRPRAPAAERFPAASPQAPRAESEERAPRAEYVEESLRIDDEDPEIFRPLIDVGLVLSTLNRWRWTIIGLTVLGIVIGVLAAMATPHRYTAYTQILVDPRQLKLVERDISPDFLANEAALAIIDSQLALVQSSSVIDKVVEKAGLADDPEFNGQGGDSLLSPVTNLLSILKGGDATSGGEAATAAAARTLRHDLWAERSSRTFIIEIGVTTKDPEKSARLANLVASTFISVQEGLRAETADSASAALSGRLKSLRASVEEAEAAVEEYKAENGLIGPGTRLVTDDQLSAVTAQLADAKAATIAARTRLETMSSADIDSVVSGGVPQRFVSNSLVALRTQYAAKKQEVASLENRLGPRHPKLADARAALQSIKSEIGAELRRIAAGAQADLRQAQDNEQALSDSLAQLKAETVNNSDAGVKLRELEREANASRDIYESFLRRARETGEIGNLAATNVNIISSATPPIQPSSMSRKIIVAMFAILGFVAGLGLAILDALRLTFFGGASPAPAGPERHVFKRRVRRTEGAPATRNPQAPLPAGSTASAASAASPESSESSSKEDEDEMRYYPNTPNGRAWEAPPHADPRYADHARGPAPQHFHQAPAWEQYPVNPQYPDPYWPRSYASDPAPAGYYGAPSYPPHPGAYPVQQYPAPPQAGYAEPYPYSRAASQPYPPFEQPRHDPYWGAPAQQQEAPGAGDSEELHDLRQSVREIRDTVEALMERRTGRRRRSA